jgi:hypothetical protein
MENMKRGKRGRMGEEHEVPSCVIREHDVLRFPPSNLLVFMSTLFKSQLESDAWLSLMGIELNIS